MAVAARVALFLSGEAQATSCALSDEQAKSYVIRKVTNCVWLQTLLESRAFATGRMSPHGGSALTEPGKTVVASINELIG